MTKAKLVTFGATYVSAANVTINGTSYTINPILIKYSENGCSVI